ncbi:hypothetical protein MKW94_013112 [Papaver nudicaule]|uniref:Uncharacterized protein n=1 Tax=Papaver nudicaule TaxID=74823 RepID=A0AA41V2D9_PAPNU|nr:hypothetical protein [Papaver nudicaule]
MSVMELSSSAIILEGEEEDDYVGFEEGRVWLPTHILDDAWEFKDSLKPRQKNHPDNNNHQQRNHHRQSLPRPKMSSRGDTFPMFDQFDAHSKLPTSTIFYQRPRIVPGGTRVSPPLTSTGTGMRAVFLESGEKKCGTGFFLPRRAGQNFQTNQKPACSPVLLPARVVEALNLNVHELGSQFVPRRDQTNNLTSQGRKNTNQDNKTNNKNRGIGCDVQTTRCVAASKGGHNSSPDIFLPKEWSY